MRGQQRGFTLIEMVVVIAVLGVLLTIFMGITRAVVSQQRYQTTRARMANIDTALLTYVTQNRQLPCPADGTQPSSNSAAGNEVVSGTGTSRDCGNQQNGVVPWRSLGLTASDAEDGWGARFTYRVGPDLVKQGAMDFTSCDPAAALTNPISATAPPFCTAAGSAATQCNSTTLTTVCTAPSVALTASITKGLVVENVNGDVLMDPRGSSPPPTPNPSTGAAYVLISHGPEGGGGFNDQGVLQSSTVGPGAKESLNFANARYSLPPTSGSPAPVSPPAGPPYSPTTQYFVDDVINPAGGHFDDFVSRPNILSLATKAQLGPRSH